MAGVTKVTSRVRHLAFWCAILGTTFAFAALWDRSIKTDGTAIESVVHITLPANELMRDIHNTGNNPHRMPAILRPEDHQAWLNGTNEDARAVLAQYSAEHMVAYEVSTRVNSPKNNDASLIMPVGRPTELIREVTLSQQSPE